MPDSVTISVEDFKQVLNPNAFTLDSAEGIIVLGLVIFMIYAIGKRLINATMWCVGGLVLLQCFYALSLTAVNNIIPISNVIHYDVMTSVAQVFAGTFISDWLVSASAWINFIFYKAGDKIAYGLQYIIDWFNTYVIPSIPKP